jgi:hypothetical protein
VEPRSDIVLRASLGGIELTDGVRVKADEHHEVVLRCVAADFTSLRGRIIDTEGHPVEGAKVLISRKHDGGAKYLCRVYSNADGSFETPPHALLGSKYQVKVVTNELDVASDWYMLKQPNQTLPDLQIDRNTMGFRPYAQRQDASQ